MSQGIQAFFCFIKYCNCIIKQVGIWGGLYPSGRWDFNVRQGIFDSTEFHFMALQPLKGLGLPPKNDFLSSYSNLMALEGPRPLSKKNSLI